MKGLGQARVVDERLPVTQFDRESIRAQPFPSEEELVKKGLIHNLNPFLPKTNRPSWYPPAPPPIPQASSPIMDYERVRAQRAQNKILFPWPHTIEEGFMGLGQDEEAGMVSIDSSYLIVGGVGVALGIIGLLVPQDNDMRFLFLGGGGGLVGTVIARMFFDKKDK
jgi:hypothetical protein